MRIALPAIARGLPWLVYFLLGILATLFGVAISLWVLFTFNPFDTRPLRVTLQDAGFSGPLCPGETITSYVRITADPEMLVDVFWGVVDENRNETELGKFVGELMRAPGSPSTFEVDFEWEVPDEPPGFYYGLRQYWVRGGGTPVQSVLVPFEIPPGCRQ